MHSFETLCSPGVINHFNSCEVTQIYLHKKSDKININLFVLAVLEEAPFRNEDFSFLTSKPIPIDSEYSVCIHRYRLTIEQTAEAFDFLTKTNRWKFRNDSSLVLGDLKVLPSQFVPHENTPLNFVLKNNFHNGSYLLELFDQSKEHVQFLLEDISLTRFNKLSEQIKKIVPIDLSIIRDRVGNILFQFPIRILEVWSNALSDWSGVRVNFAWDQALSQIPSCCIEVVSTYDGNIMGSMIVEYDKNVAQVIETGNLDKLTSIRVWLKKPKLMLASFNGTYFRELNLKAGIVSPEHRTFTINGKTSGVEIVSFQEYYAKPKSKDYSSFISSRIYETEKERLEKDLSFKQYNSKDGTTLNAIEDLRTLIKRFGSNGAYLWDPFLRPEDILNTLYFSEVSRVPLRAIGSINETVKLVYQRRKTSIVDIIRDYHSFFGASAGNNFALNLEFRIQFEQHGWPFHDRFLLFPGSEDDRPKVFSLGTSLNSFGKDHHILQEVSYPQRVIDAFNDLWNQLNTSECIVWKSIP